MLKAISHLRNSIGTAAAGLVAALISTGAFADEPNPYLQPDDSWITISGKVQSVSKDRFTLDYGDGVVTVEMDDGDRDADAYKLLTGDKVTVSGRIDDDFYEMTKIEASSVYVENLGTTFFASAIDEEDWHDWAVAVTVPLDVSRTIVYGTVTKVDSEAFTVDAGVRELRVAVDDMPYNPLDDEGYQKIGVGDRVKVTGDLDIGFFEGRHLEADTIIKLRNS